MIFYMMSHLSSIRRKCGKSVDIVLFESETTLTIFWKALECDILRNN